MFKVQSTLLIPDIPQTPYKDDDQDEVIDIPYTEDSVPLSQIPTNIKSQSQPQESFPSDQPYVNSANNVSYSHSSVDLNESFNQEEEVSYPEVQLSAELSDRPHRIRRPPDKLSMRWDKTQSYE